MVTVEMAGDAGGETVAAASGEAAAPPATMRRLAVLYEQHAGDARRLAYLLTGDATLAEDVVQDAFVRLAGRLAHLRNVDAFGPYLRRTVVNLCRMHFRRRKVERAYVARQPSREPTSAGPELRSDDDLRSGLLLLPDRQRAALVLRFYLDLPDVEIAETLRCRPSTVRSLIHRGTTALREVIER